MGVQAKRRRRSSEEVRALLIEAAQELFRANGYDATTTKDIAERAGVSETIVFSSFGSKSGLFDAAVVDPFAEVVAAYMASWQNHDPGVTPETRVESFVRGLAELAKCNRVVLLSAVMTRLTAGRSEDDDVLDHLARTLQAMTEIPSRLPELGEFADPPASVAAAAGMVLGVVLLEDCVFPKDAGKPSEDQLITEMTAMLLRGFLHRGRETPSATSRHRGKRADSHRR
jgi:AcrR family transcriptional regulator